MAVMSNALDGLGKDAAKIQPILITVDPERDSPAVIKEFLKDYHPSFIGLTGSEEEITEAKKNFRIYGEKAKDGGENYDMNHSTIIYFIDEEGSYITHFNHMNTSTQMVEIIRKYL